MIFLLPTAFIMTYELSKYVAQLKSFCIEEHSDEGFPFIPGKKNESLISFHMFLRQKCFYFIYKSIEINILPSNFFQA